jgi:cytochrome c-type biogenesis protein CcmH
MFCFVSAAFCAIDPLPFADREQELRFQQLTQELRCVKCQNNSLADSEGMIAADIRREVFRLMQSGQSDQQIVDHFVARYGDFVRYVPSFEPINYAVWFGPFLLVPLGLYVLVRQLRRQSANADVTSEEA